jgi:hypothetical protein
MFTALAYYTPRMYFDRRPNKCNVATRKNVISWRG